MERGAGAWLQGFDVSRPHTTVPALIYSRHLPRPARSDVNSCVAVSWRGPGTFFEAPSDNADIAVFRSSLHPVVEDRGRIPGGAGTHTGAHRHTDHTVGAIGRGEIFGNHTRQRHSLTKQSQRRSVPRKTRVRGKPTTRDLSGIPSLQPRVPPRAVLGRASALDMETRLEDTRTRLPPCLFTGRIPPCPVPVQKWRPPWRGWPRSHLLPMYPE